MRIEKALRDNQLQYCVKYVLHLLVFNLASKRHNNRIHFNTFGGGPVIGCTFFFCSQVVGPIIGGLLSGVVYKGQFLVHVY